LQRNAVADAEIDKTVNAFLADSPLSESMTLGVRGLFPQKAGMTRDKITCEEVRGISFAYFLTTFCILQLYDKVFSQVQRLRPAEDRNFSLADYEAACGHADAIEEGYRIARKTDTTYTNVVLVSNSISSSQIGAVAAKQW
jgi:hypothetical protein